MATIPAVMWAQSSGYPITLIPPGKGPYTFPAGYQVPWDKIEIMVTAKMSPNLFVLHGSEGLDPAHPDATFVEDTAVLSPKCSVITRPGAPSRSGEGICTASTI